MEKREVKRLIISNPDEFVDLGRALSKVTITMRATSKMSFLQFLNIIENHENFEVNDFVGQFSRAIIAPRDDSGFDTKPKGFTFYVPIMLIFSMVQIICFMHDYITWNLDNNIITEQGRTFFDNNLKFMNGKWSMSLKVGILGNGIFRYITYQFAHGSCFHLICNVMVQLLLGIPLEFMHGSWRVMIVYLAGVLSGSVCHLNFEASWLGGASAGDYAIMTAHISSVLMVRFPSLIVLSIKLLSFQNWKAMRYAFIHLLAFLGYFAYDVYSACTQIIAQTLLTQDERLSNASYSAHLGGGIAGLLIGIGMLRNYKSSLSKRVLWIFCVTVYCSIMIIGMLSIHCKPNSKEDPSQFCVKYNNTMNEVVENIKNFTTSCIDNIINSFTRQERFKASGNCTESTKLKEINV